MSASLWHLSKCFINVLRIYLFPSFPATIEFEKNNTRNRIDVSVVFVGNQETRTTPDMADIS